VRGAGAIRLLVLDVDGVLTDGRLYFGPRGEALKVFDVRDGYGLVALHSSAVRARCRELGVRHVHQGVADKLAVFERLRARLRLARSACACVGDDLPDVPLMRAVALAFAVADAHPAARRAAAVVTRQGGGHGAVREVCDLLLTAAGSTRRAAARR
jgi:3-deoxy-D-manno-octulosonate 8-phosphate phosphatase (KDO 8-P phosphatase)